MHVVATAANRAAVEPGYPLIRHVIAILVGELPYVRRRAHIDSAFVNEDAFRERHVLGKDGRVIEYAIAVAIGQTKNAMAWRLELNRRLLTVPGTVRDIERASFIEIHMDRPLDQRRRGHRLQGKPLGQAERMRWQVYLLQVGDFCKDSLTQ